MQLSGEAEAEAARRMMAHASRLGSAIKLVALTPGRSSGQVRFGDVLVVAQGSGNNGNANGNADGLSLGDSSSSPLLFLMADPISGRNPGVWEWPEHQQQQQAPPRALPVAAAAPPPPNHLSRLFALAVASSGHSLGPTSYDPHNNPQGTACTALRLLPAAKGQAAGDVLRYGDRFALAIEDPGSVWGAGAGAGAGGAGSAAAATGGRATNAAPPTAATTAPPPPLLLLTSRSPVAALCPTARAPGDGVAQAVAFVEWCPPQAPAQQARSLRSSSSSSSAAAAVAALPPSDAAWVALPTDPEQRVLLDGEPVRAALPLLLAHAPTRRPLWFGGGNGGGAGDVVARWGPAATRTRAGSPSRRAHGADLGPPALPGNVWRFVGGVIDDER